MGLAAGTTALIAGVLPETLAGLAPVISGSLIGAGGGALLSGVTGGDPGMGALGGAITGGFIPAGGALAGDIGLSSGIGDVLGGIAGGALGAGITGGNPLLGAALGGVGGGVTGFSSGGFSSPGAAPTAGAGSAGVDVAAPTGAAGGASLGDFTDPSTLPTSAAATDVGNSALLGGNAGVGTLTGAPGSAADIAANALAAPNAASNLSWGQMQQALTSGNAPAMTSPNGVTFSPASAGGAAGAGGGIGNILSQHPLLTQIAGLGGSQLLSPLLQKISGANKLTPAEQQMLNAQRPGIDAANALIGSLQSGVLPPGAQTLIDQNLQKQIADIRSRYASLGMSNSSAELQDIQNAQNNAQAQAFQVAQQATATGLNALGLNQNVYSRLVQDQLANNQNLSSAMSNYFAQLGQGTALGSAIKGAAG